MRFISVTLLLILVYQKVQLRNTLLSLGWNLTAAGYVVWAIYNVAFLIVPEWFLAHWVIDGVIRVLGFVFLIAGASILRRDLKELGKSD